jgi:hypothetical protein
MQTGATVCKRYQNSLPCSTGNIFAEQICCVRDEGAKPSAIDLQKKIIYSPKKISHGKN